MPHLAHMSVALFTAVLVILSTAALLAASCDLNPVAPGPLASPEAVLCLEVSALDWRLPHMPITNHSDAAMGTVAQRLALVHVLPIWHGYMMMV